jgi:hypothetical protein
VLLCGLCGENQCFFCTNIICKILIFTAIYTVFLICQVTYISPFAEIFLKSLIYFAATYSGNAPQISISGGCYFWRLEHIQMSNKSHGNFRQNLAKLAAKTGFLAEIQESHFNFSERTVYRVCLCEKRLKMPKWIKPG